MQFKKFINDKLLSESLEIIEEGEATFVKLNKLNDGASLITQLKIVELFDRIRIFMKTSNYHMKIVDLKNLSQSLIEELKLEIKILLLIKEKLSTKLLDGLIIQSTKLAKNIKQHYENKKKDYDESRL